MKVEILGTGCRKCKALYDKVRAIAASHQIEIDLIKVQDLDKIIDYGVMLTPGLVIDGKVKASGKIPADEAILKMLLGG